MLARREYSAAVLRSKLVGRGYSAALADTVLNELQEQGWQDDGRYADGVVRKAGRGYGPLAIRQRLRQAGIQDAPALAETDWQAALAAAYRKKYGETYPDSREEYARRGRFLQGRGFAVEQIKHFIQQLKQRRNGEG